MIKVWLCLISLALANFFIEAWHDVPNYSLALEITWSQMWALIIYHFIWEDHK